MPELLEETNFDYIVLGTGFNESVLAGAFARAGKKVLHLDSQQNYGGNWCVFGFKEAAQWYFNKEKTLDESIQSDVSKVDYKKQYSSNFQMIDFKVYPTILSEEENEEIGTKFAEGTLTKESLISAARDADKDILEKFSENVDSQDKCDSLRQIFAFEKLLKTSRLYNIETAPKLLNSREELVDVLIRSGVGRYLEFKSVEDIFIFDKVLKKLEKVPGSKEDVFTSKSINLIEKRKLMKFLTFALEYKDGDIEVEEEKFKISGKLLEAIIYAIALVDQDVSAKNGLDSTHRFVKSMGRFGRGSYICTLYGGASEIAQAFCRVCAVYGGTYILNIPIDKILVDGKTNKCTGVVTKDGNEYNCKALVSGIDYLPLSWLPNKGNFGSWLSRAIVATDYPLKDSDSHGTLAYSIFPPGSDAGNSEFPIYIVHESQESMACPKDQYITYFWTASKNDEVLENALDILLKKNQDDVNIQPTKCIFKIFYNQRVRSTNDLKNTSNLPKCVLPCSDPDVSLDFHDSMKEIIESFHIFEGKDVEFMPAAENDLNDDN